MEKKSISPFPLRIEPELRKVLEDAARENGRSLQAEIIARLVSTSDYKPDSETEFEEKVRQIVQEELRNAGVLTDPPEREPGFSIPMQRKSG